MIVADGMPPPELGMLKGLAFFGVTLAETERGGRWRIWGVPSQ
jgi:hypothetical protein